MVIVQRDVQLCVVCILVVTEFFVADCANSFNLVNEELRQLVGGEQWLGGRWILIPFQNGGDGPPHFPRVSGICGNA